MKIYVGTDGSDGAAAAVRWAGALGAATDSEVTVVHALQFEQSELPPDFVDEKRAERRALLDGAWSEPARESGAPALATDLQEGDPADILRDFEDGNNALVVVGSRGEGGFEALQLGSTASRLAHHVQHPLAVVPAGATAPGGPVVIGADGSKGSDQAVIWGAMAGKALGSGCKVVLVHDVGADSFPHPDLDNWKYRGQQTVESQLASLGEAGAELVNVGGNAITELQRVAAEDGATCIAVGSHGHGHLHRHLLGRVPAQLLAHPTAVPVVIAPHHHPNR